MLYLDFSSELLNYNKENTKAKQNITDSLVKTLTQLTEINSIKIFCQFYHKKIHLFTQMYQLTA